MPFEMLGAVPLMGHAFGIPKGATQQPQGGKMQTSRQSVADFLDSHLKAALKNASWRPGKVYLALFAGTDPVGKVVLAWGGPIVLQHLQ